MSTNISISLLPCKKGLQSYVSGALGHTVAACLGLRALWAGLPHVGGLLAACDFPSVA